MSALKLEGIKGAGGGNCLFGKDVVSDDLVGVTTDFGDYVIDQDVMAAFLAQNTIRKQTQSCPTSQSFLTSCRAN